MYSALSSIVKNLILTAVLVLSVVNFFYVWFTWKDLLAIQSLAALAYIFLSCYEFLNAQYKASLPVKRYFYFSNSYMMFKLLKVGFFLSLAVMLFISGSRVKYLYPICVTIAFTEAVVTWIKYSRGICFVNIYANYLLFSQDKISKLFATEIALVEFRHEIFYFIKKNGKTVVLKLEHIREKEQFILALYDWLQRNRIPVGQESEGKLNDIRM